MQLLIGEANCTITPVKSKKDDFFKKKLYIFEDELFDQKLKIIIY